MSVNAKDPEAVAHAMNDLKGSDGWLHLEAKAREMQEALLRRICDPTCEEIETQYLRGQISMLVRMIDHPAVVLEQCHAAIDEINRTTNGTHRMRRNPPRDL